MRCPKCIRGPEGLLGHGSIVVLARGDEAAPPLFGCIQCNCRYERAYPGRGVFLWNRLADVTREVRGSSPS